MNETGNGQNGKRIIKKSVLIRVIRAKKDKDGNDSNR